MAVNKVILMGNLGKDPVYKKFDNGSAVSSFTLATSEKYKDKSGTYVTKTEWHNIDAWSPLAEIAEKYLKKGNQVYIEGKIESRDYTDKDGIVKKFYSIKAKELNLIGGPNTSGSGNEGSSNSPEPEYNSMASSSRGNDAP
ncbi:MAG: single-stranded DNA-binding protein, partial [Cytophagales bacterium]